jgi:hypothetical protein
MSYLIYPTKAEAIKTRDHITALAKQYEGFREETVAGLKIGSGCVRLLAAIKDGTFEVKYAHKILCRHPVYPIADADGVRYAIPVTALVQKYSGHVDTTTGNTLDLTKAVAELPADWAPETAAVSG